MKATFSTLLLITNQIWLNVLKHWVVGQAYAKVQGQIKFTSEGHSEVSSES